MSPDLRDRLIEEFSFALKHERLAMDPHASEKAAELVLDVLRKYLADPATVMVVDTELSHALLERAEANHRGATDGPTVSDMARRILVIIMKDL